MPKSSLTYPSEFPDVIAQVSATVATPARAPTSMSSVLSTSDVGPLLRIAENIGSMGHWRTDLNTGVITWSAHIYRIVDRSPADFTPDLHAVISICHPDDRAKIEQVVADAAAGHSDFEFDCRLGRPDGTWRAVVGSGQSERDAAGRVVALFGVLADVTEAFDALQAMQDQNEMLDLAAQLAQLGHWVWNQEEDRISFCSEEMARIHEMPAGTFMSQFTHPSFLAAVVAPEERDVYRAAIRNALVGAKSYRIEYKLKTHSGEVKNIREIGQPIFDVTGKLSRFIATVQDVTEAKRREQALDEAHRRLEQQAETLKRNEEELTRKTAELQRLNLQKDKLFSIVAHDLRSPFNSIIGFADLLVTNARDLSHGQTVSYAQIVRESAMGVHNLLDNLLAWASFQMRESALKLAPLDMSAVAAASIEPLAHMAENKGVTIANNVRDVMALGDEPLVQVVIRNLVCNGIKFSRQGGVVQLTAAQVGAGRDAMIRITVRDDGVGMSGTALGNLFELDRTVSAPGTRGEPGTGLGLYLCRDIVVRHGGGIDVDSTSGAGTAFHFTLPAALN